MTFRAAYLFLFRTMTRRCVGCVDRRLAVAKAMMACVPALALVLALGLIGMPVLAGSPPPRVTAIRGDEVESVSPEGGRVTLKPGQSLGPWTLMAVTRDAGRREVAVWEDFTDWRGSLRVVDAAGGCVVFPKSLEPTFAEDPATLYRGRPLTEVLGSDRDVLGDELLARPGDPDFARVAACLPPLAKMHVYSFVGTPGSVEKVGVFYGGWTPNFDPVAYVPAIGPLRDAGRVWDGLVGGWLPVLRFVYPEKAGDWTELLMYAPFRVENGNHRVQPVWYRLGRIEGNRLRWVRYFDSYHPSPPRAEPPASAFYGELLALREGWERELAGGMTVEVPDRRLADLARHSLVRARITRIDGWPKYGVFDRGYGGSEHDGFPDTFTVDTSALLAWGHFARAAECIDNYLSSFVRDDGSILYRGPETGQYGRMLTVLAEYANRTGDTRLLLKHRRRIDAIARLLLGLQAAASTGPADDPAFGLIRGWSEADACLDPEPGRYVQPYFGNSTEAARGWRDLGTVWERVGTQRHDGALKAWGRSLVAAGRELDAHVQRGLARSLLTNTAPPCLPAIAGVTEPFHVAAARDKLDPQFRSYRGYMEMLFSGSLSRGQVATVRDYRAAHRDLIVGLPACYGFNTHELAIFLTYGHAFGLLQHDFVREFLLTTYSHAAHGYTRGLWTAPETRNVDPGIFAAPYCVPAQLTVPLLLRWMLVFDDPATGEVWLAKGTPREWLKDGAVIAVTQAPVNGGRLGFRLESQLAHDTVRVRLDLPSRGVGQPVKLRLRVPGERRIRKVTLDGKPWDRFDPAQETVDLPAGTRGAVELTVGYGP